MFKISQICSFLAIVTLSLASQALTLKEKKKFEEWNAYLKDSGQSYVATVKKNCNVEIPVTMEEKLVTSFMEKNANAASYCDATRSVISGLCSDKTTKEAIASQIKRISCKLGGKDKKPELKLASGELQMFVGPEASNLDATIKNFLENNLK